MSKEVKWDRTHDKNGQLHWEIPYVNGQRHGISRWWKRDGKLWSIAKWHRDQRVIELRFDHVPGDAKMELDLITNIMTYETNIQ
jgi:antitoxin component YwqK of YwqJK toxin-antitoxin module